MRKSLTVFLSGVALVYAASTALAGEHVLEFKLVTKPLDVKVTEAANIEGQSVASGKLFGVAVFKDGRIGVKDFVNTSDMLKGSGSFFGYSTYTFEDGQVKGRIYDPLGHGCLCERHRHWNNRKRAEPVQGRQSL